MSKTYTQKEMDEAVKEAYEKGRESGNESAAKSYECDDDLPLEDWYLHNIRQNGGN
jgi:hypothetical protein